MNASIICADDMSDRGLPVSATRSDGAVPTTFARVLDAVGLGLHPEHPYATAPLRERAIDLWRQCVEEARALGRVGGMPAFRVEVQTGTLARGGLLIGRGGSVTLADSLGTSSLARPRATWSALARVEWSPGPAQFAGTEELPSDRDEWGPKLVGLLEGALRSLRRAAA